MASDEHLDVIPETEVERVENAVGIGHGAWDMVDPREIILEAQRPLADEITRLRQTIRDREAEILRLRTHEMRIAHFLDSKQTQEERTAFNAAPQAEWEEGSKQIDRAMAAVDAFGGVEAMERLRNAAFVLAAPAFRSAVGRRSYVTATVSAAIADIIPHLSTGEAELMAKEIETAIEQGLAGDQMDADVWSKLARMLREERR